MFKISIANVKGFKGHHTSMKITGRVHKFGDDINTDEIIPAKFLDTTDEKELAAHCMAGIDGKFIGSVKEGDIIVAGKNFGCGSSREHAPVAIKAAGIKCVVAESFARIFYRNAINIGLSIVESPEAPARIKAGDVLEIDPDKGVIRDVTGGKKFNIKPFPEFIQEIISAGGLMAQIKRALRKKKK